MSDKEIVEKSDLMSHLLPGWCIVLVHLSHVIMCMCIIGDVVVADRVFTCQDHLLLTMVEVKIPPFTKGKKQLSKLEVDWSRELSMIRIHVERVIGILKQKYTILQSVLPINLIRNDDSTSTLAPINKIVSVCS